MQTVWAPSTEARLQCFINNHLIESPQANVRKSTQKLLLSLYRIGTYNQQLRMLQLLICRANISTMGSSAEQFLGLLTEILRHEKTLKQFMPQKIQIVVLVVQSCKEIFKKIISQSQYDFYATCANMVDFPDGFKPALLEANGCWKCFGKPTYEFEQLQITAAKEELKMHLDQAQFVLRRKFEIKNLKIVFGKKKMPNVVSVIVSYRDEAGNKITVGKYSINDNIPVINIIALSLFLQFVHPPQNQTIRSRRNEIQCFNCSSNEQYSHVCGNCIANCVTIEGSFKVIGGDPQKISKELCESYDSLNKLKEVLESMWVSMKTNNKVPAMKQRIVFQMQRIYTIIMANVGLLNTQIPSSPPKTIDCYSCHFAEFQAIISFFAQLFTPDTPVIAVTTMQINTILTDLRYYTEQNKLENLYPILHCATAKISLQLYRQGMLSLEPVSNSNHSRLAQVTALLITSAREKKLPLLQILEKYVLDAANLQFWDIHDRVWLFVVQALDEEEAGLPREIKNIDAKRISEIKRTTLDNFKRLQSLINFQTHQILDFPLNNSIRMFLKVIPMEMVPACKLYLSNPQILKYTVNKIPSIRREYIEEHVVHCPQATLKLNELKLLPQLMKVVPMEEALNSVVQLCEYKSMWNTNIREAVDVVDRALNEVEKTLRLQLCLQSYHLSHEPMFFDHVYRLLTPQRPSFIIRLDVPQQELTKEGRGGEAFEYIYLPIQEVRSEQLRSDTMGALHEWVTAELTRINRFMPFDMIVEKSIIDNMDLSLDIVYRKIVQKEAQRRIGNKTYEFFRVIYKIQGVLGEGAERIAINPRDDKLQECVILSSYLLNKVNKTHCGLDILMKALPRLLHFGGHRVAMIFSVLEIIFKNESIVKKIVQLQHGDVLIHLAVQFLSLNRQDLKASEALLQMCSKLIDEFNSTQQVMRKKSIFVENAMEFEGSMPQSREAVQVVLEKIKEADQSGQKTLTTRLVKILPFCSKDDQETSLYLFQYFEMAKLLEQKFNPKTVWLLHFVQALSQNYTSFREISAKTGVTKSLVEMVARDIACSEWSNIKQFQLNLQLLKGLLPGDNDLQLHLLERGVINHIHRLSSVVGESKEKYGKIPSLCYEINKYFISGKKIAQPVLNFYSEKEKEHRLLIDMQKQKKKKELLAKGEKAKKSYIGQLLAYEPETMACLSCKEGYQKNNKVLGVYIFTSKVEIIVMEGWYRETKRILGFTSTSCFTSIHLDCHQLAQRDDNRNQKQEWDGASIRNGDVVCNNWVAYRGLNTTDEEFDAAHRKYFEKNNKNCSYWVVFNDLNNLLDRFSHQEDFAHETRGSSVFHNIKLMLVLIAYTAHLGKSSEDIRHLREGAVHLEANPSKKTHLLHLLFCSSVFLVKTDNFHYKKKPLYCTMIENLDPKEIKVSFIYLCLVTEIINLLNRGANQEKHISNYLTKFIADKFNELLNCFEKIGEKYQKEIVVLNTPAQFKKYLNL